MKRDSHTLVVVPLEAELVTAGDGDALGYFCSGRECRISAEGAVPNSRASLTLHFIAADVKSLTCAT